MDRFAIHPRPAVRSRLTIPRATRHACGHPRTRQNVARCQRAEQTQRNCPAPTPIAYETRCQACKLLRPQLGSCMVTEKVIALPIRPSLQNFMRHLSESAVVTLEQESNIDAEKRKSSAEVEKVEHVGTLVAKSAQSSTETGTQTKHNPTLA
ncbi:hypothetical protein BAUCODRAFT_31655 [Baudoinia panamericana UAMH 10762]|uniref:Uncharacterized protein n=1 Tax=Baudoinia panamericana (strain UAMH 10762) TaxID=717646 RepID=M2NIW6_BAUPA|nr:uncharacterized protein BAUCODRAFT_31655 [Baudoinia panamericana UAMH 10762]EMC99339.1 hypothetical protein BAUCODRAFT_31655 [Baudoinia panamericana UAMH 10762]